MIERLYPSSRSTHIDGAPLKRRIVVATVDGRAFYVFIRLLKRAGLPFSVSLPWEAPSSAVVLTTRKEAISINPRHTLLYEELSGDNVVDIAMIASSAIGGGREELIVGIDPGVRIGIAVYYKGMLVHADVYSSPDKVAELLEKLLALRSTRRIIRIGFGNPELAMRIIERFPSALSSGYVVEFVDESRTSREHRKPSRDVGAAIRIAGRKGRIVEV